MFTLYVFERRQFIIEEIREPVWSYIIDVCSSFSARDCNACFSQIFEKKTFGYLNEEEENQLGLDNNMWPLFVTEMHTNLGRLNCANCDTQPTEPVLLNVLNSRFLFIEFPPALMKDINVFEEILSGELSTKGKERKGTLFKCLVVLALKH